MHVRRLAIRNVRSIRSFDLRFSASETAGWHVILGSNGSGKSSIIRSLALALAGPKEAAALRQNWNTWAREDADPGTISLQVQCESDDIFTGTGRRTDSIDVELSFRRIDTSINGPRMEVTASSGFKKAERTIWGTNSGWFSASFGPFRRFTGGDQAFDRLYFSNPRLAAHLSAFGEDVALTEGLRWLRELRVKELEERKEAADLLGRLINFLNTSTLLPHGAKITEVRSEEIIIVDGGGSRIAVEQLSDGYRSILSMIFEILRQMTRAYDYQRMMTAFDNDSDSVDLSGVVAIDEIDAHLHPSWQKEIGPWFTRCFPRVQFIVTTHSPIICRNANSVWNLPSLGTDQSPGRVEGVALNRLIYGSILEAYGTEFFGSDMTRSEDAQVLLDELALLNRKAIRSTLDVKERARLEELRKIFPTNASN